jgi:hypothetical protein
MIFLCYAREDRGRCEEIEAGLAAARFPLVKDEPQPEANPSWRSRVRQSMQDSQTMLILWSEHAEGSPWVEQEIRAFHGIRVWLRVDDTPLPAGLSDRDLPVHDSSALCAVLSTHVQRSRGSRRLFRSHAPARSRRDVRRAAKQALDRVRRQRRPDRTLTQIGRDGFVLGAYEMAFRTIAGDVLLGVGPVTVRQYGQFLAEAGAPAHHAIDRAPDRHDFPVVAVTWYEAQACAEWLGGTLPAEAEWQQAAETAAVFPYATATGAIDPALAWFGCQFATADRKPASDYPANAGGFHGMCGNTWDWCATRWDGHRVIRGGSWQDTRRFCAARARYRNAPVDRDCTVGFRVRLQARRIRSGEYAVVSRGVSG